jgi:anthranilate synthase component 2
MNILLLDNYDSFTYNVAHYIRELGYALDIARNDKITLDEVARYDKIALSPGPGVPEEAGVMPALIRRFAPEKSILGVCLGHQAIGEAFGGALRNLDSVFHGVATRARVVADDVLFRGLPREFAVGRYHSWAVEKESLPDALEITAVDADGEIMAMRHRAYDVRGVQFHPESILTEHGAQMLKNWLESP